MYIRTGCPVDQPDACARTVFKTAYLEIRSLEAFSKMATGVKDDSEDVTYLDTTFPPDGKRTRSAIVRRSFAQQIVSHLKGQENPDKAFRHFVKKGQYLVRLLDLPAVGIRDALVVQVKQEKKVML